jgi:ADP-heptose:LPS heptosyltransferase
MPQRIGILRTGSMGDHLIAVPIYRRLREMYAADRLVLITNLPARGNAKLVGPASFLPQSLFDEWHDYPVGSDLTAILATYRLFRRLRLDRLVYLMPKRSARQLLRDRLFFRLARLSVIGLPNAADLEDAEHRPESPVVEHEMNRLARLVAIEVGTTPRDLSIELTPAEHAEAALLQGGRTDGTLVLSIGTKLDVNHWGLDKWSALVRELASLPTIERLVLIGAPDEFADSEILRRHWPRESHNFCGRLSPRQSAAVLARASLFVGHDSGPMHLAAAVNVPIVAIFSSRNPPGLWFPLSGRKHVHYTRIACQGCGKLRCEELDKECIRRISVADVFASCVATWSGQAMQFTVDVLAPS